MNNESTNSTAGPSLTPIPAAETPSAPPQPAAVPHTPLPSAALRPLASRREFLALSLTGCAACAAALAGCGSGEGENGGGAPGAAPVGATPLVKATRTGNDWL